MTDKTIYKTLDEISLELELCKNMLKILGTHFDCERSKEIALDYLSVTRYFKEYEDLRYVIQTKLETLTNDVEKLYHTLRTMETK